MLEEHNQEIEVGGCLVCRILYIMFKNIQLRMVAENQAPL